MSSWTEYYYRMLDVIRSKSKDTSSKVGALIVGPDNEIRSTGFNGFPRGTVETPERIVRPIKYLWTEHAERNALYNALRAGIPVKDCTMWVDWWPCCDCARAIIQSGIKEVIIDYRDWEEKYAHWSERWGEQTKVSIEMMREAGIILMVCKDGQVQLHVT